MPDLIKYNGFIDIHTPHAPNTSVYLFGEKQKYVVAADSVHGWLDRYVVLPSGTFVVDPDDETGAPLVERVFGEVEIRTPYAIPPASIELPPWPKVEFTFLEESVDVLPDEWMKHASAAMANKLAKKMDAELMAGMKLGFEYGVSVPPVHMNCKNGLTT